MKMRSTQSRERVKGRSPLWSPEAKPLAGQGQRPWVSPINTRAKHENATNSIAKRVKGGTPLRGQGAAPLPPEALAIAANPRQRDNSREAAMFRATAKPTHAPAPTPSSGGGWEGDEVPFPKEAEPTFPLTTARHWHILTLTKEYGYISIDGLGRARRVQTQPPPKAQARISSQAKGPEPDEALESSNAPKRQSAPPGGETFR